MLVRQPLVPVLSQVAPCAVLGAQAFTMCCPVASVPRTRSTSFTQLLQHSRARGPLAVAARRGLPTDEVIPSYLQHQV